MKTILQFFANVLIFIYMTIIHFLGLLWTGKLPKISLYHQWKESFDFKESFHDKLAQAKNTPINMNFENSLLLMFKNPQIKKELIKDVDILNDVNEPCGTQTLYSLLIGYIRRNPELFKIKYDESK